MSSGIFPAWVMAFRQTESAWWVRQTHREGSIELSCSEAHTFVSETLGYCAIITHELLQATSLLRHDLSCMFPLRYVYVPWVALVLPSTPFFWVAVLYKVLPGHSHSLSSSCARCSGCSVCWAAVVFTHFWGPHMLVCSSPSMVVLGTPVSSRWHMIGTVDGVRAQTWGLTCKAGIVSLTPRF